MVRGRSWHRAHLAIWQQLHLGRCWRCAASGAAAIFAAASRPRRVPARIRRAVHMPRADTCGPVGPSDTVVGPADLRDVSLGKDGRRRRGQHQEARDGACPGLKPALCLGPSANAHCSSGTGEPLELSRLVYTGGFSKPFGSQISKMQVKGASRMLYARLGSNGPAG